jgi:hypothetical protein
LICKHYHLEIACVNEIPCSVQCCDDVHNLIHVKHNPSTSGCTIIITMAVEISFDLREGFLNWIQVR